MSSCWRLGLERGEKRSTYSEGNLHDGRESRCSWPAASWKRGGGSGIVEGRRSKGTQKKNRSLAVAEAERFGDVSVTEGFGLGFLDRMTQAKGWPGVDGQKEVVVVGWKLLG